MCDTEEQPTKKMKLSKEDPAGLPAGAKPLSHQVAGHGSAAETKQKNVGFYECEDGTILKALHPEPDPRGPREVKFYQKVFDPTCQDPELLELRPLLPKYFDVVTIPGENEKLVKYIKLEDLAGKYKKPCVIDVKIGKITYDPEASEEKKRRESSKYPPLKKTGFQLRGFKVYSETKGDYEVYSKNYMQELDENTILTNGLKVYFSQDGKLRTDILAHCLEQLQLIQKWFEKQKQFAFFASSVLIVYEGLSDEAEEQNTQNGSKSSESDDTPGDKTAAADNKNGAPDKTSVDARMIDFAHVFPATAKDENYSHGLENLISYLQKLLTEQK